ncbi:hypothetical protein [Streptomyces sp. NPDC058330]|uniref:hypothetical protein n=1 Tax=Streptomyces sp. NPDC058330 TaxID=3346449 RepID=UPI0036E125C2
MTTPETPEIPGLKDVLARARAASGEIAAALDEDQEPEPEEPVGWQSIWKRPRTPKSKVAKKKQLHDQRERLQDAAKRRHRGGRAVPDRRGWPTSAPTAGVVPPSPTAAPAAAAPGVARVPRPAAPPATGTHPRSRLDGGRAGP